MTTPLPARWTVIAVRFGLSSWTELPNPAVPMAEVQSLICLGTIESRTRADGRRTVMEVRAR